MKHYLIYLNVIYESNVTINSKFFLDDYVNAYIWAHAYACILERLYNVLIPICIPSPSQTSHQLMFNSTYTAMYTPRTKKMCTFYDNDNDNDKDNEKIINAK